MGVWQQCGQPFEIECIHWRLADDIEHGVSRKLF